MSRIPIASAVALLISAIFLFLAAMTSTAQAAPPKRGGPFQDPVSYCRAVRTIDWPDRDRRYAGPKEIGWINRAMGWHKGDSGYVAWGCEDGFVVACVNGGITGPCEKFGDRSPSADVIDWCRSNPNDRSLPTAVMGHSSLCDWRCARGRPLIGECSAPDKRSFRRGDYVRVHPGR